jgi:hypothetical protein
VHGAHLVTAVVGLGAGQIHVAPLHLAPRGRRRAGGPAGRAPPPPAGGRPGRRGGRRWRRLARAAGTATAAAAAAAAGAGVLEVDLLAELEPVQVVVPAPAAASAAGTGSLHCCPRPSCPPRGAKRTKRAAAMTRPQPQRRRCWWWFLGAPLLSSPPRGRKEREVAKERNKSGRLALKITPLCSLSPLPPLCACDRVCVTASDREGEAEALSCWPPSSVSLSLLSPPSSLLRTTPRTVSHARTRAGLATRASASHLSSRFRPPGFRPTGWAGGCALAMLGVAAVPRCLAAACCRGFCRPDPGRLAHEGSVSRAREREKGYARPWQRASGMPSLAPYTAAQCRHSPAPVIKSHRERKK